MSMKHVNYINKTTADTHNKYKYNVLYTFKPNILLRDILIQYTYIITSHNQNRQKWIKLKNIKTNLIMLNTFRHIAHEAKIYNLQK
jgi:hypothetical protein